jgi:succinyl-CoA synthetase beta subunit
MKFYEFEAKKLLAKHGIPVPKGAVAGSPAEAKKIASDIGGPVLVKAQVFGRWRSADGGVQSADDAAAAEKAAAEILGSTVRGDKPARVLVEQKVEAATLYSLNATYDGAVKSPMLVANTVGNKDMDDVAETEPAKTHKRYFSALTGISPYQAKELAKALGMTGSDLNRTTAIASALARVLMDYDLTFAEINALGRTADGKFVALDAHLDMEAEGIDRQGAVLEFCGITDAATRGTRPPTKFELEAAKIDDEDPRGIISPVVEFDGTMGCVIGAGGGSITTFDAIKKHGGKPANYAAIGGNPSVGKAEKLTKLVLSKPGVEKICVISNVVSNTRADLVARGVIKGCLALGKDPKEVITVFRVPGAWEADAVKILKKYDIEYCDRTVSLSEAAKRAVANLNK